MIAELIKKESNDIKIVCGGPYITIKKPKLENVDGLIIGEGEEALLEYCKNQKPLIYSNRINDLDSLPYPDRENLLLKGKYLEYGHIITGRGCPFNCIFCASKKIWGNAVRLRSVDNVVSEMEEIERKYNQTHFLFRDDTFTINKERTIEFCNRIKDREYKWQCDTRIDNLSYDILTKMRNAGCNSIRIGVESGNERMITFINKKITKDKVRQVVKDCKDIGINITTYFIVGLPTETNSEVMDTINFIREINPDNISISIATPYTGTLLEDTMNIDKNHLEKYFHQSPELINNLKIDKELIEELFSMSHNKKQGVN